MFEFFKSKTIEEWIDFESNDVVIHLINKL